MTGVFQVAEYLAQLLDALDVQPARGVGQGGCANFYGDPHGVNLFSVG